MQLCHEGNSYLTTEQRENAICYGKVLLKSSDNWIVQNATIEALAYWAKENQKLKKWLLPRLGEFILSERRIVASSAQKALKADL